MVSSSHPLKYPAPAEPPPAPSTRAGCLLSLLPRGTRARSPPPRRLPAPPHPSSPPDLTPARGTRAHPTSATATATPPSSRTPPPHNAAKRPNPIPLSYPGVNHGTPAEPRTTTSTGDHRGTRLTPHPLPDLAHLRAHPTSATATATPPSSRTPPPHNAAKRPNPIPLSYPGVNQKLTRSPAVSRLNPPTPCRAPLHTTSPPTCWPATTHQHTIYTNHRPRSPLPLQAVSVF